MAQDPMGAEGLEKLLGDTRRVLESMRAARAGAGAQPSDVHGEGEAAEGRVRAVVTPGPHVESLHVDPRLMRLDPESLCTEIVSALNAALADLRGKADTAQAGERTVDPAALSAQLRGLQEESVARMAAFGQAMNDILARLGGER
ncbi:MAG: YbaB/EbfC family nucleoid-associated protein [Actinobacteria bacterium]|nr:MAG: YbaB/EbfC family nucleoid-associated protein [Actinomycetota bacterium]